MGTSVIACCDTAPVFEFGEHVFDFVPLAVEGFVIVEDLLAVFSSGDAWRDAPVDQRIAEPIAVIATVCDQCGGLWHAGE